MLTGVLVVAFLAAVYVVTSGPGPEASSCPFVEDDQEGLDVEIESPAVDVQLAGPTDVRGTLEDPPPGTYLVELLAGGLVVDTTTAAPDGTWRMDLSADRLNAELVPLTVRACALAGPSGEPVEPVGQAERRVQVLAPSIPTRRSRPLIGVVAGLSAVATLLLALSPVPGRLVRRWLSDS